VRVLASKSGFDLKWYTVQVFCAAMMIALIETRPRQVVAQSCQVPQFRAQQDTSSAGRPTTWSSNTPFARRIIAMARGAAQGHKVQLYAACQRNDMMSQVSVISQLSVPHVYNIEAHQTLYGCIIDNISNNAVTFTHPAEWTICTQLQWSIAPWRCALAAPVHRESS
jgi:hypothetical protein